MNGMNFLSVGPRPIVQILIPFFFPKLHLVDLNPRRLRQATDPRKLDVTGTQRAAPWKNESCPPLRSEGRG